MLLSAEGAIKLGDFGISRSLSTFTHFASTVVGTPYPMAPEVLDSTPYAHAADVWALDCVEQYAQAPPHSRAVHACA